MGAVVSLALVTTACGTRVDKQAFYDQLRQTAAQTGDDGEDFATGALTEGDGSNATSSGTGTATSGSPGASDSADPLGSAAGDTAESTPAPSGAGDNKTQAPNTPNVSDEVVGDTVKIGFHVPISGAAPIPTDFSSTVEAIERYFNEEAPLFGRQVEFHIEDDGYDAQVGLAACKKIAEVDPLFVVGHTMPAAQDACADEFGERGIPYLMRGTYPEILDGRPLAWFGTAPDDLQGQLLGQYVLSQLDGVRRKSAIVYQNDQVAAKNHFVSTIEAGGGEIVAAEQSVPRQPDYSATVEKLDRAGAEFVFLSMPPVDAIKLSSQAQGAGYHPTWLGGGTYWNYNLVLESAGTALDGAIVFSPWASVDSAAAKEYREVFRRYRPNDEPDDIGLIIWGWSQLVRTAMEKAGPELSRASFVEALQDFQFNKPYWVPVKYTPTDHTGANSVAVFRADGQAQRWRQITGFVSGF